MKLLKMYFLFATLLIGSIQASNFDNRSYESRTLIRLMNLQDYVQCIREDYQNGFSTTPLYCQEQLKKAIELDDELQSNLSHKHTFTHQDRHEKIDTKFIAIAEILEEILTENDKDQQIRRALYNIVDYRPGTSAIAWKKSIHCLHGKNTPLITTIRSSLGLQNTDYPATLNQMLKKRLENATETVNNSTHSPAILLTTESKSMRTSRPDRINALKQNRFQSISDYCD